MAATTNAFAAEDFPKAPANQKEAEAQGLQRVNLEDLKKFIPGIMKDKGARGGIHTLTFKPDGSVNRTGEGAKDQSGKWHFDEKNNAYCVAFQGTREYKEICFAVFRAADAVNFFDYDVENGFYARVWHPGE